MYKVLIIHEAIFQGVATHMVVVEAFTLGAATEMVASAKQLGCKAIILNITADK